MKAATAIYITGLPCTGKTTIANRLAESLHLICLSKDEIKELMFDHIGFDDRSWSKKLGGASFELLYWSIEKIAASGASFLVDADFSATELASKRLRSLQEYHGYHSLEVQLFAEGEILFERFKKRSTSGERHLGHVDHTNFEEFRPALLQGRREYLSIPSSKFEVDTSDFDAIDYDKVLSTVSDHMTSTKDPAGSLI